MLTSEPGYQAVIAARNAAEARTAQARDSMWFQINGTANTNFNKRNYDTRHSVLPPQKDEYNSHTWQLNATLPLIRPAASADRRQAYDLEAQAGAQLASTTQATLAKLSEAWFDLLAARDNRRFAQRQADAAQRNLEIIQRGLELGVHGLPQKEEAAAKALQGQAELAMAEADVEVKRAALEQLTGTQDKLDLPGWHEGATIPESTPKSLNDWLLLIESANNDIHAAMLGVDAARDDVRKQQAGHYPTIDLVGNYGLNSQAAGGFPGQNGYEIKSGYTGLQANWNLFSSGVQSQKVRESYAMVEKAESGLENARRTAINNTKQAWYAMSVSVIKEAAARQAVIAAQSAIQAATRGESRGLKTDFDILQGRQQLAAARRDLAKSRYDRLLAMIRLKALAGALTLDDLDAVDRLFQPENEADQDSAEVLAGGTL